MFFDKLSGQAQLCTTNETTCCVCSDDYSHLDLAMGGLGKARSRKPRPRPTQALSSGLKLRPKPGLLVKIEAGLGPWAGPLP